MKNEDTQVSPNDSDFETDAEPDGDVSPDEEVGNESKALLDLISECISERKGHDLVVLDLRELTPIVDYFVICSGSSSIHTRAVSEHIEQACKKANFRHLGVEGREAARWILMDYGEIVVHIFQDETRWFYNLEHLWGDARRVASNIE